MTEELRSMEKFNFLLGVWDMEYTIPKSCLSEADYGKGKGEFKTVLNNKYVMFDYSAKFSNSETAAYGIFVWDKKNNNYRYWWFEDSGEFSEATCDFIDENILCMNWHNSLLVQTFSKKENGTIALEMRYPIDKNDYKIVLQVIFTKQNY